MMHIPELWNAIHDIHDYLICSAEDLKQRIYKLEEKEEKLKQRIYKLEEKEEKLKQRIGRLSEKENER